MKEDTHVEGPWDDTMELKIKEETIQLLMFETNNAIPLSTKTIGYSKSF